MELGEYIKRKRKEFGLTAEQLAEKCGVNPSTVYRWENGDTGKIPSGQLKILAEILMVRPSDLIDDTVRIPLPAPESMRTLPVYDCLSCGTGLFVEDQIIDMVSVPLAMLPSKHADYFAQYAKGDSMTGAGINDGDILIFKKTSSIENGQIGCFCIDENVAACKKFSQIGGSVYLMPANDKYQPIPIEPENQCFRVIGLLVAQVSKR